MAQDADQATNSAANLNIPANVQLLGKVDPHLRKATAIVNGAIITGTDVDQRLALIILANGGQVPDAERDRLRLQVLRNLIDERLQIQEAKTHDITIERSEIDRSYNQVAQRFKQTPEGLGAYLRNAGSSDRSIKGQIEGELAWSRLLRRQVEPFVNVSGGEVQSVLDRLQATKGAKEYRVSELYLSATPETAAAVSDNARKIIEAVRGGGSFQAYARQFSEASTASVGGDLGWVRAGQLPEALAQSLETMQNGQIAGPIAIPGGFSILVLQDSRQVLTTDPRDAVLNLRQISLKFDAKTSEAEATARASALAKATQAMGGCGKAQEVATQLGAELVDNDQVKIRDLPAPLQETLLKMSVGESTPPFGSMTEGVRVLVMCGRDEAQTANGPSFDQIMSQMEEDRVNQRAQRYLRDLRRDAIVEYR
ncbi:peptidylprolyl isomerase [Sphingomonas antarctica]|uniref:peptidylprolyl isomerase n=1 Tax=Sphingomonas antarctica TaxID=2040274 RepID=UPI0039E821BF